MKRMLMVAMDFPYPPCHGAAVDMWSRLLVLRQMGYRVDLLATVNTLPSRDLMRIVREHVGHLWLVPRGRGVRSFHSFLPFQVCSRKGLQNIHLDETYDAIVLESEYVAGFLRNPAVRHAKVILRIHNEQVGYFRDLAEGAGSWLKKLYYYSESLRFRFYSPQVIRKCDLLWFISDSERQTHIKNQPGHALKSYFVPTQVNPRTLQPFAALGQTALFIGTLTITHNTDAVAWFIEHVHPLLSDLEGYAFQVAGRTAGKPLPQLKQLIQRHEHVLLQEDPVTLDSLYHHAAVFVNPVICGAGVKIKLIQALEAGMPVVSTSMGMEGTGFEHSVHLLVADTPLQFATCVRKLILDRALARSLVHNAQAFLALRYDMKANMQEPLADLMAEHNESRVPAGLANR